MLPVVSEHVNNVYCIGDMVDDDVYSIVEICDDVPSIVDIFDDFFLCIVEMFDDVGPSVADMFEDNVDDNVSAIIE